MRASDTSIHPRPSLVQQNASGAQHVQYEIVFTRFAPTESQLPLFSSLPTLVIDASVPLFEDEPYEMHF
jgi:hypothetical protein